MIIVKKLAAEFEVKLTAERCNTFLDLFGLQTKIFFIIKSDFCHKKLFPFLFEIYRFYIHTLCVL